MEAAFLSGLLNLIEQKIWTHMQEKHELRRRLKDDIDSMKYELGMIGAAIEDHYKLLRRQDTSAVTSAWIDHARKLSHDIEDCMDLFLHRVAMERHQSLVHRLKTMRIRTRFAEKIRVLKERSTEANKKRQEYTVTGDGQPSTSGGPRSILPGRILADEVGLQPNLVGMDESRKELLDLLKVGMDEVGLQANQTEKLKIVSIVGFDGLGKTSLARDVFNDMDFRKNFDEFAWVDAAADEAEKILLALLKKFKQPVPENSDFYNPAPLVKSHLKSKRYLIVIDDVQKEQWNILRDAFPKELCSRIIVTTSIHTVAKAYSSGDHYIYKMKRLDENDSKKLFFREASNAESNQRISLEENQLDAKSLLNKCDGIPLALICTAQYVKKNGALTWKSCEDACQQLGHNLENDDTLEAMKQLLLHKFVSLSGHYLKACMQYIGMFPSGHHIMRNSLFRRWSAEGFVGTDPRNTALNLFKELVDQSIVQSAYDVEMGNKNILKKCRTPGIMLEFLSHKSSAENFIKFFCNETCETRYVRRLALHQISDAERRRSNLCINLSLVRSLIIFGEAGEAILNLRKYKLLRVLDLEECTDIRDRHLNAMCKLLHLKYVSLGRKITKVPRNIAWLHYLETLDMRKTQIKEVSFDVIRLPHLAHLYGMFQLRAKDCKRKKIQQFSSEESNLQTLAGFITDKNRGFPQFLFHMKKLRKVKVRCEPTADSRNLTDLAKSVREYIREPMGPTDVRSLSISSDEWSKEFLTTLQGDSYLSSLKLHGKLSEVPQFVTSLCYLSKLRLSSTTLSGDCLLQGLSRLCCLLYLKLEEDNLGDTMTIKGGDFWQLQCLCIVVKTRTSLQIEKEAAPRLTSLQLVCKDLYGFPAIDDHWFPELQEIILDSEVQNETIDGWNAAAKEHPKRPKVLQIKGDSDHTADRNATLAVTHDDMSAAPEIPSSVTHGAFSGPQTSSRTGSASSATPMEQQNSPSVHQPSISHPTKPRLNGKRALPLRKVKFSCFQFQVLRTGRTHRGASLRDVGTDSIKSA